MDLQNKYQILASEFAKVRGQNTVLKKAVIDEQNKNQQLQENINQKDQNLRRNAQEIETFSFLNNQLKSRLEVLQQELNEIESNGKLKRTNTQELELKIKQYETIQRRVYELEKQIVDHENERSTYHSQIEEVQNQISEMQQTHQHTREEYERIFKQLKQENELLNQQIKQHLTEPPSTIPPRKPSTESSSPTPQPEISLYKYINAWKDAFTELTIYIEERLRNNHRSSENNEKMAHTAKAFQQHAENFLLALKNRLFEKKEETNSTDFAELFSMFVSSCEKVLAFATKSVCDESNGHSSSENQDKVHEKIAHLNTILNDLFQQWAKNLSQIRELSVSIIQLTHSSSLPLTSDQLTSNISQILSTFQTGAILHCDLDKHYNDKLCLEYELNASPVHLTTTDECILAALRKLSSLDQQIAQLIRENQNHLFDNQNRDKLHTETQQIHPIESPEDSHQQLLDGHKKQIFDNAEIIGTLEQEKEHWRLEYQLLKIKFEKMRDDYLKQLDEMKGKSSHEPIDDQRDHRTHSDPPNEREVLIKQYYSQKIHDLETKLQLANGKGIAFYNELANIHQRLKHSKDQEGKCRMEIDENQQELMIMRDELSTTTKGYEEQIAMMSDHLASMNEQITSQNEKIDKLQQQLHINIKDGKKGRK